MATTDYPIRVLSQADRADDETCLLLGEIDNRPGKVQAVARRVTDPELIAAYAHRAGPGEVLVKFDRTDILGTGRSC
jgi:hypothetical protein